jgi:uncharacterized OB-fold protein
MKPFSGTSLTDHALTTGEVLTTLWRVKANYAWDTGIAIGKYLEGLKQGKILGVRCPGCHRTVVPPRAFCELCFRPINDWVELPDTGKINTYSVSYVNWDATRRQTPEVPAVIEIDGASPGIGILHLMGEVGDTLEEITARLKLGVTVQAVWKPAQEREGAITDIRYFRPIG